MILQKQDRTKSGRKRHTTKREFNCQSLPVTLSHQVHNFQFVCQTHAQAYFPKVVAQGDTLFSAKHVLSYITQPPRSTPNPPSFLPSSIRGFSKINSSHPTSWTPASYLLNKNKMNIFSSSFYFAPPATFTRISSCQLCFVVLFSGMFVISFRVHSRLCCRFVSFTYFFLFLLLVVVM